MRSRLNVRRWPVLLLSAAAMAVVFGAAGSARANPGHGGDMHLDHAVFTETNTVPNSVLIFRRNHDGTLDAAGQVATGGDGAPVTNPPLGLPYLQTNGEVVLGGNGGHRCLFAVNAGSNTISSFDVDHHGIDLADVESSFGIHPVSLTTTRRGPNNLVLYVLNSQLTGGPDIFTATGGTASIQGFYVSNDCSLAPIGGSHHLTTSQASSPTTIAFNDDGSALAVMEPSFPTAGDIDIFPVDGRGVAGNPVVSPSAGTGPYGAAWDGKGHLTVTNWNFANPFAGTVSSYKLAHNNTLTPISTVPSAGHPCWNVVTDDGRFLFTTNPAGLVIGTPQVLGFSIGHDGGLTPLAGGQTTPYNAVDEALSDDSDYLYVLNDALLPFNPTQSAINAFAVNHRTGQLTPVDQVNLGFNGTSGLAAW
jgi:6-phosphogluconolactonase